MRIDGQFGKPDAVDYKSHIIYDLKPWEPGGEQTILKHYSAQFEFYKQLYFKAYEIEPTIKIVIHSAPQP